MGRVSNIKRQYEAFTTTYSEFSVRQTFLVVGIWLTCGVIFYLAFGEFLELSRFWTAFLAGFLGYVMALAYRMAYVNLGGDNDT